MSCQSPQTLSEVLNTVLPAVGAIGSGLPGKVLCIHIDDVLSGRTRPAEVNGAGLGWALSVGICVSIWEFVEDVSCQPHGTRGDAVRLVYDVVLACSRYVSINHELCDG